MQKVASLLFFLLGACASQCPRPARAQQAAKYTVCLRFVTAAPRTVQLNQQRPFRVAADTCLQLPRPAAPLVSLLVEAEGCFAQTIRFRPDTLRGPLRVWLLPREVALREVVVQSASAARYRGDTLVLRVDSVRTQPHASASDLLNNMAGASVDASGQVRILGKNIGQVTVEGKPLYGGNPKAALEALNADMIKNLELSEVPGAGGEGGASLNIRLKDDHKAGSYGRVDALAGTHGTYAAAGRVSQVQGSRFLSAFATANNIYEQALTADDQNTLVRNTVLKQVQGAYSVTETALPRPTSMQADRGVQNIVEQPLNVGQVNTVNGGLNYSQSKPKADLFGYVLAERTSQQLSRTFTTTRYLDPLRQREDGASEDAYRRTKATAYLNGKWTLTPQQTLTTASLLGVRRQDSDLRSTLATELRRDTARLTRSMLTRQLTSQEQSWFTSTQAVWVLHHARPAEVTSVYVKYGFSALETQQDYTNQVQAGARAPRVFRNQIERQDQAHSWEAQALHALPLSRKLLLEGKLTWSYETAPIAQRGYRPSGAVAYEVPGLTLGQFRATDQQQTARVALYYKTARFSALLSPTVWHWAGTRRVAETTVLTQQRTALLPGFFAEYRPDAVTRLSLRYGESQLLPAPERLFPVPDSANIQFIKVGNPYLVQTRHQTLEASGSSALGTNRFTLTVRYGVDNNPVLLAAQPNSLGLLTQSYQQPDLRLPSLATSLLWFQLNQVKSYSFHAFMTAQWLRNYVVTQGAPVRLRTFLGVAVAGIKWQGSHGTTAKLDWRTTLTQQQSPASDLPVARNFRHEPVLALEQKWGARCYAELTTTAFINSYAQGPVTANAFLDATLSRYCLRGDRARVFVSGRNLLNNTAYQANSFAANVQRQETVGRLPRLVLLGISVYPEKWK